MINVRFTADPLPSDFRGSMQDFQDRFLLNLSGEILETQVLVGQVGGSKPTTNIGPWLNQDTWYVWNGSDYVPQTIKIGNGAFVVQLGGLTTVGAGVSSVLPDVTQIIQDKDGTIALLSDVYEGRSSVTLSTTTPTIDWSQSNNFTETLSGNTTIKMINSQDGQEISVALRNNSTSYTVTWPTTPAIFWTSGTPPTQTASKTDLYILKNIGGSIFGRQIANY